MLSSNTQNTLLFTENAFSTNHKQFGLLRGDAGIAMIFYLLAKETGIKLYKQRGRSLLERVSENSNSVNSLNFERGFTGIGWCIEWLIQNGFINDLNSDEILLSIDQESYKAISFSRQVDCSLFTGLIGKIWYFEKRISSENANTHRYRYLANLEAFVFLTDDLESILINESNSFNGTLINENKLKITNLGTLLTTCSSAFKLNVNRLTLENILFEAVKYSEQLLSEAVKFPTTNNPREKNRLFDYLYLSIMYFIASKNYDHPLWALSAKQYIGIFAERVLKIRVTKKDLLFKKMSILCLLNDQQPKDQYRDAIVKCLNNLSSKDLPMDFFMGIGKLVLTELYLENRIIINNWHELFLVE